jgi:hypothetical protein
MGVSVGFCADLDHVHADWPSSFEFAAHPVSDGCVAVLRQSVLHPLLDQVLRAVGIADARIEGHKVKASASILLESDPRVDRGTNDAYGKAAPAQVLG